jgi:hypothetical protein
MAEEKIYKRTREFLCKFVDFVREIKQESGRVDSDEGIFESDIISFVRSAGKAEGRRLKGWGLMSGEFEEVIHTYAGCFGITMDISRSLKLPLEGIKLKLHGSDQFNRDLWVAYASSLLSIYGMEELRIEGPSSGEQMEEFEIKKAGSGIGRPIAMTGDNIQVKEYVHKMNNYLGGILSFASLISTPQDKEKAKLIVESAKNIEKLMKKAFPNKEEKQ